MKKSSSMKQLSEDALGQMDILQPYDSVAGVRANAQKVELVAALQSLKDRKVAEAVEIKKAGALLADRSFWSKGSRAASLGSSKLDST